MKVAAILKGRKTHSDVSLVIAPASRQIFSMLAANGALAVFLDAGARIVEPVCAFCIGNCHAPRTDGVSLRTTNRNFKGRSGTKSAKVYLVSPETAAVSAITGKITDPAEAGFECSAIDNLEKIIIDDSMIIPPLPEKERAKIEVARGPNIGQPLSLGPLADSIKGKVELKVGDKITTDDIMPAGARLKYRSNIEKYAQFVFEQIDPPSSQGATRSGLRGASPRFSQRCLDNKAKNIDSIIVGGASYGQGSSREHAAICPRYLGVKAVIAKSFERIHFANLVNYGIIPLVLAKPDDYEKFNQSDEIEINGLLSAVKDGLKTQILNKTKNVKVEVLVSLSARQREILLAGGILNHARK
jgi:aconitate hydratase